MKPNDPGRYVTVSNYETRDLYRNPFKWYEHIWRAIELALVPFMFFCMVYGYYLSMHPEL